MTAPCGLSDILVSGGPRVATAIGEALHGHPAYLPIRRAAGPMFGGRGETCTRLIALVLTGGPLPADDLGRFRDLGVLAARQAIPLPVLSEVWDLALAAAARTCWTIAPAGHFAEMAELTAHAARLAIGAREACIQGYAEAPREGGRSRPLRRLLAETLIDGAPAGVIAEAAGVRLAPAYLVLLCEAPAAASCWERASERLDGWDGVLYSGDLSGLIALFPAADPLCAESRAAEFTASLAARARGPVHAAEAFRRGLAGIPEALEEASRVLTVAKAIPDAEDRPYRADELLVELAILDQPAIRGRLAAVLKPLDAGTDLRRTLEVLLACNLDRERAARELWIHRRTLHYRLDRIRDLSGVDPSSARGIQLFRAALTSARLASDRAPRTERDGHRAEETSLPPPLSA
ncbi:PucR family transcriptional regulator [Actinomadura bangladeshensis]|uniref:PucR family transcriptional regulator n=1 Tax=Actinomadura bangladeshensis TaxID=453573 RepID=A0A4R4NWE3_9ACTN|nr:helix-turn-helix domain-containing protein [Actinomadura bangladeshensis]TDC12443.1 PucR family transcriptional regulator [Actinomadura bangladeshensis]